MTDPARLLLDLAIRDVYVHRRGANVVLRGAVRELPDGLLDELRPHKLQILAALADSRRTARAALDIVIDEIAGRWTRRLAETGQRPTLPDAENDTPLTTFNDAVRAGDLPAALEAVVAWRCAWFAALEPATPPAAPAATCAGGTA